MPPSTLSAQYDRLVAYAARLSRDPDAARDLVHDAWERLLRLDPAPRRPAEWLAARVRCSVIDLARKSGRWRLQPLPDDLQDERSQRAPDALPHQVERVLRRRGVTDAELAALVDWARGYEAREISERHGIPLGTAFTRVFRARRKL